jgi:nicotinate-nucleotide adenylyltransferase
LRRIAAIFGGSFDPPHIGHVLLSQYLLSVYGQEAKAANRLAAVWWVPCFKHAFGKEMLDYDRRLKMCKLATASFSKRQVKVSDIERRMQSDGRMLLVLRQLAQRNKQWRFKLVVGEDILNEKDRWYQFDKIDSEFGLIVVPRGGKEGIINVSSTQIRAKLSRGQSVEQYLPAGIERYISKYRLYSS